MNPLEVFQKEAPEVAEAFIRLQTLDPGACLSLLYGLEGAIEGVKWNKLPSDKKRALQQFYKLAKKK